MLTAVSEEDPTPGISTAKESPPALPCPALPWLPRPGEGHQAGWDGGRGPPPPVLHQLLFLSGEESPESRSREGAQGSPTAGLAQQQQGGMCCPRCSGCPRDPDPAQPVSLPYWGSRALPRCAEGLPGKGVRRGLLPEAPSQRSLLCLPLRPPPLVLQGNGPQDTWGSPGPALAPPPCAQEPIQGWG